MNGRAPRILFYGSRRLWITKPPPLCRAPASLPGFRSPSEKSWCLVSGVAVEALPIAQRLKSHQPDGKQHPLAFFRLPCSCRTCMAQQSKQPESFGSGCVSTSWQFRLRCREKEHLNTLVQFQPMSCSKGYVRSTGGVTSCVKSPLMAGSISWLGDALTS